MKTKLKCIIVDDEEMATKVIETHLAHIPDFEIVGVYHSAVEAFLALDNTSIDVLFLDIQMPKITGLDMIKMLKKKPLTVLTTAHREFALEGFDLEVVDYLMKPIGLSRFLQTISRLKKHFHLLEGKRKGTPSQFDMPNMVQQRKGASLKKTNHIFIKTNKAYQKIAFDVILHIEAVKNHIKIVTKTHTYFSLVSLSEFEHRLPEQFLRVHRSFIINTLNILQFNNHSIQNDHNNIPIGRTYKDHTIEKLKQLL